MSAISNLMMKAIGPVFLILVLVGVVVAWRLLRPHEVTYIMCPGDMTMCADGSMAGRVPPTCDFACTPANAQ